MIERVCETCGNHFFVKPYRVREGTGRFCSSKCWGQSAKCHEIALRMTHYERTEEHRKAIATRIRLLFKGKPKTEDHKRKIGEANKGNKRPDLAAYVHRMATSGAWKGENSPNYGRHHTEKTRENMSKGRLAYIARTPIEQFRLSDETKAKLSAVRKQQWQDPEYVAKLIKAMALSPNKLEQRIIKILEPTYPEYKYNGDFGQGICLGGLTPAFVNINGRKEVIEILGDYWHSPEIIGNDWRRSAEGKVEIYKSVGHKCLILWESEINQSSDVQILEKVHQFHEGGKICLV